MGRITIDQARQRVLQEVSPAKSSGSEIKRAPAKLPNIEFVKSLGKDNSILLFKKNDSYILTPADDELNTIIGEIDEIPDENDLPPCFSDWVETYNEEVIQFENGGMETCASNDIELVDLGLSVKWANMNIGANSPEDFGNYYAWGETKTKETFKVKTYEHYDVVHKKWISLGNDICGTEYDTAFNYDNSLCMPTADQFKELMDKCSKEQIIENGKVIWKFTGPNGNYIVIPAAGCCSESTGVNSNYKNYLWYWSSTKASSSQGKCLRYWDKSWTIYSMYRRTGAPIRPVEYIQNNEDKNKSTKIDALIPYKWNQRAPFNDQLPIDPVTNSKVITGCNATALSMVIAYWGNIGVNNKKYFRGCTKTSTYTSNSSNNHKLSIPSLTPIMKFDYDNLLTTSALINASENAKTAVSTLLKYVGYAIKSNYSSSGTSASLSNDLNAIKNYFRLGTSAKIIYASNGLEKFKTSVYDELSNKRPVMMAGWNSKGQSGHMFICDGYNPDTDKFHFNWGWGGSYNGWFDISILSMSSNDFSYYKQAIIGINPEYQLGDTNNDGELTISDVANLIQSILDKKTNNQLDINSDGVVDIEDLKVLIELILK